jgi:PAS domain S-box-containing protein
MRTINNGDASGVLSSLPLCMVTLNSRNLHPVACNGMFERVIGPLYKFANGDFITAACSDDKKHKDSRGRLQSAIDNLVGFSQADNSGVRKRVRDVEITTLCDENSGFPIRRRFDWFISKSCEDPETIILLGDPCSEHEVVQREKEAELVDFFQNAPIALHWLTGDGKVMWANQTELNVLGYTAEEYIGQPIMKFCPDEEELVLEIFKQLGSGNAIRDVPVRFRTKDGKMVHLLIDSNVRYESDGSFGHTRCFIRDDTGRKIREARASLLLEETKRSLRMLDNFMSRTLHHLR